MGYPLVNSGILWSLKGTFNVKSFGSPMSVRSPFTTVSIQFCSVTDVAIIRRSLSFPATTLTRILTRPFQACLSLSPFTLVNSMAYS